VAGAHLGEANSTAYWSYANGLAGILIAVSAPFLGTLGDRRGYKKRLLASFWLAGVVATGLLSVAGLGHWALWLGVYVVARLGYGGSNIFYDALLVDVAKRDRMDWVSMMGFAWGYIGSVLPFLACIALYLRPEWFGLSSQDAALRVAFPLTAAWWLLLALPLFRNVEQVYGVEPRGHAVRVAWAQLRSTLADIRKYRHVALFLVAYFFYIDGIHTVFTVAASFARDQGMTLITIVQVILAVQVVAFPCAVAYGWLAKRFGTRTMLFCGIGVYIVVAIWAFFLEATWQFWVLGMLVATSQGGVQGLSRSYFGAMVPPEKSSEFFGFYNICGKFAIFLGPIIVGVVAQATGESRYGVFSLIALFAVGAILLAKVPPPPVDAGQEG
jgi:UMF1 family MFS transporter